MLNPEYRDLLLTDVTSVVSLNKAVEGVTSPMDVNRFKQLFALADLKLLVEVRSNAGGFVLGMTEGTEYENGNYKWFSDRLRNFLYIDRIVVSEGCRGFGIGRQLYSRAVEWALKSGRLNLCAEMDLDPPNQASLRFHQAAGFVQIGTRTLTSGKLVSLQILPISDNSADG